MNELMNQSLTIERRTTPNKYGEYTYVAMRVNCRLEMVQKQFRNISGEITIAAGTIYSSTQLINGDRLTYEDVQYSIASVETIKDIVGNIQHYQAYLV